MSAAEVRERDLLGLRGVVSSLRAPRSGVARDPDAGWATPPQLLSRDPEGPGVRWTSLELLRDLLHCDGLILDGCDAARRERFFGQMVSAAGPDFLHVRRWGPDGPVGPRPALNEASVEAEVYFWDTYRSSPAGHGRRTGDWDTVLDLALVFRDPLYEWCDGRGPGRSRGVLAAAPLGPERHLGLFGFRRDPTPFSERELGCLELLKPHVVDAWRRSWVTSTPLTAAQCRVLGLVRDGHTNRQVARDLGVSEATVRTHLQNAYAALGVNNRVAAVAAAFGSPAPNVPTQPRAGAG